MSAAALELDGSAQAVLIVEEPFADGAVVEALYTEEPDAAYLSRIAGPRDHGRAPARPGLDQAQPGRPAAGAGRALLRLWRP